MGDRLQYWNDSLTSNIHDVQDTLSMASQQPPTSSSRSSLLSDARRLLVRCRLAKASYKSEMNRLDDGSSEKKKYEERLKVFDEGLIKAGEDLQTLERGEDIETPAGKRSEAKGCDAIPAAAIGAEGKMYDKMHWLFDPLLEFTTVHCGCDPISFAEGTGGRYQYQNSAVEEYFDVEENNDLANASSPGGVGSISYGSSLRSRPSRTGDTPTKQEGSSNGGGAVKQPAPSAPGTASPVTSSQLEERGQRLEHLSDQTNKLESGAQTFADLAMQLKNKAKEKAGGST